MGRSKKRKFASKFSAGIFIFVCLTIMFSLAVALVSQSLLFNRSRFSLPAKTVQAEINSPPASSGASVSSVKTDAAIENKTLNLPVLTYHYLSVNPNITDKLRPALSVIPEAFEQQLAWLKENSYQTISLDDLAAHFQTGLTLPPKPIILTFDDGYLDFYTNAYPLILKYQAKATVFIIVDFVGRPGYLTWNQITEMKNNGSITFASHALSHPNLPRLTQQQQSTEIFQSKKILEQKLGYPVNFFSYPYGSFNDAVVEEVKKAGYIGAVGTTAGKKQSASRIFNLLRTGMDGLGTADLAKFIEKIKE